MEMRDKGCARGNFFIPGTLTKRCFPVICLDLNVYRHAHAWHTLSSFPPAVRSEGGEILQKFQGVSPPGLNGGFCGPGHREGAALPAPTRTFRRAVNGNIKARHARYRSFLRLTSSIRLNVKICAWISRSSVPVTP